MSFSIHTHRLLGSIFCLLILSIAPFAWGNPSPSACGLYQGENTLEALMAREAAISTRLRNPDNPGLYCEWAHIDYRRSNLEPDRQREFLDRCLTHADEAIRLNPGAGAGYFFKGLCLGKQGEAKGIWSSLNIIDPFRENMEAAVRMNPEVDEGGPHRALGRLYYKLPFFLGGSLKKSIHHLEQAIRYGPNYWENHFFLAQSYYKEGRYPQARDSLKKAIQICSTVNRAEFKLRQVELEGLMAEIQNHIP